MRDTRLVRGGLIAIVITPVITAVVRSLRNDWFPIGDNALLFIRTRDVFTAHHPLLGSWTSASLSVGENMNNPGSLYDFLIAPFAHALPPGPAAALGVGMVNILTVVGISIASRRIGGWTLERVALATTAVLLWSMGSELLFDIWQANALVVPFLLFLILIVGCASGRAELIPWTIGVGSLLVQTHISYAYIFVFLTLGAFAVWTWQTATNGRPSPSIDTESATFDHADGSHSMKRVTGAFAAGLRGRHAIFSVGVVIVLWAQPVIEQLFGEGKGNLARLAGNSGGGDLSLGPRDATRIVAAVSAFPNWWSRGAYVTTVPITRLSVVDGRQAVVIPGLPSLGAATLGLALVVGLLVFLIRLARRASLDVQVAAGVVALTGLLGSVASLSLLTIGQVGLSPHHVRWIWPLIAFVHLTMAWMAIAVWNLRRPSLPTSWATPSVAAFMAIVSFVNVPYFAQASGPVAAVDTMPVMEQIKPHLALLDDAGPLLYDVSNVVVFEPYSSTMMMWLQERDIEFRVDDEGMVRQLGNRRRADGTETVRVFQLQGSAALSYDGDACEIGAASVLDPADEDLAGVDVEGLVNAVLDQTITIQAGFVGDDAVLSAAIDGDFSAAREKVLDGTIPSLIRDGFADVSDAIDPRLVEQGTFDRIGAWAFTAYALYADGLEPCV